jgi:hypothetical protein
MRVCACLSIVLATACGEPPVVPEEDGGVDARVAPPVDGGPPDAPPSCDDFTGAYRVETGSDPCFDETAFDYGILCVAQNGCTATIFGSHGDATATVEAGVLSFDVGELRCTAERAGELVAVECFDTALETTCGLNVEPAPEVEGACCTSDAECTETGRCAPITLPAGSPLPVTNACVFDADRELGDPCSTGFDGADNCAAGLTCTQGRYHEDRIVCRVLCDGSEDCAENETCVWYALSIPKTGYCFPSCELYGDDCGTDTCDGAVGLGEGGALVDALACRAIGVRDSGEVCEGIRQCPADHTCARASDGMSRCLPICGPDDPCTTEGDRCLLAALTDMPSYGACSP